MYGRRGRFRGGSLGGDRRGRKEGRVEFGDGGGWRWDTEGEELRF